VVVAVNLDKDHELAGGFLREFHPRFPIVYDKTAKLAEQFHITSMPYSMVLDRDGKVKSVHTGFSNDRRAAMEEEIRQLLN
jgi:peroxiredoxin